ncbi:hypothetical protein CLV25_105121 [Acetobacteroides hydrogenigenes]|uniref:Uncharacterized protein n=1 Tax=Acetobacteroides hydrogenigenes TaxID=979970 RepID=A0A4R2EW62_9BACT|nr:hypothetical protein CLV25_105121 [Acetobacteroides hydrogenigenes]
MNNFSNLRNDSFWSPKTKETILVLIVKWLLKIIEEWMLKTSLTSSI